MIRVKIYVPSSSDPIINLPPGVKAPHSGSSSSPVGLERFRRPTASALTAGEKTFRRAHINHGAEVVAAGPVAHDMALAPLGLKAERSGQHFGGRFACLRS